MAFTYLPSEVYEALASSGSWIRRLFNLHAAQTHPKLLITHRDRLRDKPLDGRGNRQV